MAMHSGTFFYSLSKVDTFPDAVYTRRRMLNSRAQMARLRRRLSRRKAAFILMVITRMILQATLTQRSIWVLPRYSRLA